MDEHVYPPPSKEMSQKRQQLAPEISAAFHEFSKKVFADGALPSKTKQEAIWVAAEMRAGGAYAHSVVALETMAKDQGG